MIMQTYLYTNYSQYIHNYFSNKVQKIPIDIGCTCPVRDGSISRGGCSFCNGRSFIPRFVSVEDSVVDQIKSGINFFKSKTKNKEIDYIVYFQSGTNTYMPLSKAQRVIEAAMQVDGVKGLVFSTRPDCLPTQWLNFLKELSLKCFVEVELGVESVSNSVLADIGRGHDVECSVCTIEKLHALNIPVCAHMILGLPGESHQTMLDQATFLNDLKVEVVKLHQLQILRGSRMEQIYNEQKENFKLFSLQNYVSFVCDYLKILSPQVAVERFVSQSPSIELIAPKWGVKNDVVTNLIIQELRKKELYQGCLL